MFIRFVKCLRPSLRYTRKRVTLEGHGGCVTHLAESCHRLNKLSVLTLQDNVYPVRTSYPNRPARVLELFLGVLN